MNFYMPVKIFHEEDCVTRHGSDLAELGRHALIVSGRHSAAGNGSLRDVINALENNSVDYTLFQEVEANPSVETIMKGRDLAVSSQVDFVIGVGGGSAMDAAKLIALMACHPNEGSEYLFDKEASSEALPVAEVPTTCGTGSEVTAVAIVTVHEKGTKMSSPHRVFPSLALIDGRYIAFAHKSIINDTALDALGHLVESMVNKKADRMTRMICREGLKVWSENKGILKGVDLVNDEAFNNLMFAATIGGIAIAQTGTTIPHALSYLVTCQNGMPHGRAVAIFLPEFLAQAPEEYRDEVLQLTGFESLGEMNNFILDITDSPDVRRTVLENSVEDVMARPEKLKNVPFKVNRSVLEEIAGLR